MATTSTSVTDIELAQAWDKKRCEGNKKRYVFSSIAIGVLVTMVIGVMVIGVYLAVEVARSKSVEPAKTSQELALDKALSILNNVTLHAELPWNMMPGESSDALEPEGLFVGVAAGVAALSETGIIDRVCDHDPAKLWPKPVWSDYFRDAFFAGKTIDTNAKAAAACSDFCFLTNGHQSCGKLTECNRMCAFHMFGGWTCANMMNSRAWWQNQKGITLDQGHGGPGRETWGPKISPNPWFSENWKPCIDPDFCDDVNSGSSALARVVCSGGDDANIWAVADLIGGAIDYVVNGLKVK